MDVLPLPVEAIPPDMRSSVSRPSAARIYDWFLGGAHNWAIDRAFGQRVLELVPDMAAHCRENRRFLNRVVRYALDRGVRQFLDVGSGLPTVGNVHEVAELHGGEPARVVYVDNDPVAHSLGSLILDRTGHAPRHRALRADPVLDPAGLWRRLADERVLDVRQPICLLVVAVLHFAKDAARPHEALAELRRRLPPGSLLALSHWTTTDGTAAERAAEQALVRLYEDSTHPVELRPRAEIARFFGDFELVEPGLVYAPEWHPTGHEEFAADPARCRILAGAAWKV